MKPTDEQIHEAADRHVFVDADHNRKWSNNDDTAGDNFGSFKAGAYWAISKMQPEWLSVKDKLPEKRQYVVINYWSGYDIAEFKHGLFFVGLNIITDVTHWMPLPQPPTK